MSHEAALARLENRVLDLLAWRNRSEQDLLDWTVRGPAGDERPLRLGERWDVLGWPALLAAELDAPAGRDAVLELSAGGEGLVLLDERPVGGLNPFHREFPAAGARRIAVELVPKGLVGVHNPEPRLEMARLVVPNREVRALHRELDVTLEAARELAGHDVQAHLIRALDEALALLRFPSETEEVLARLRLLRRELEESRPAADYLAHAYQEPHLRDLIGGLPFRLPWQPWSGDDWAAPAGLPVPGAEPEGVAAAREHLRRRLDEIAGVNPPTGRLALCAHAHIDLAWLWPLVETRRKVRRTFATVLSLMERYPDFPFAQSSAQVYAFLREDDPDLYERVRARVREGRWEPIGGMWVEPDCNLPSGESLVRQLLYGQRFFERDFGRRSRVAWLPDTFGFTGALPQILAGAGIRYFFTQKLSWNETNRFPYDLWLWEGLDGSRVLAHAFENPIGGYNGQLSPRATLGTWCGYRSKVAHPESLLTYGHGDGGGGPTAEMLERLRLLERFPALPRLRHCAIEPFFESIAAEDLPVWVGELYLEFHRGTYTTQGRLKRLNRAAEHRLVEAEAAAVLAHRTAGDDYPAEQIHRAWTTLLRNQFHDILPGTSIREVNHEAERELGGTVALAEALRDEALISLASRAQPPQAGAIAGLTVFNLQATPRALSCRAPLPLGQSAFRLLAPGGREIAYQRVSGDEILVHDPGHDVPGLGYVHLAVLPGAPGPVQSRVAASDSMLENEVLRVDLAADGALASVYDKRAGREVLDGPGNQLWAYQDRPRHWGAWDIEAGYEPGGERVTTVESMRVVEPGPLQAAIEVVYRYRASRIEQRYVLRAGSPRLEIQTRIDWHERRVLLRALFPLAVRTLEATCETAYGAVTRPTHRNTSWDAARFEVPAHRWADLSEAGYGVSLLNDGRYGHSAHGNVLGLSLLRSPVFPDPYADAGRHAFTYALLSHTGDWRTGGTVPEALDLNSPLLAVSTGTRRAPEGGAPERPADGRWLRIDGLSLGALKRAEDSGDLVLRLYDPYGGRGTAEVETDFPLARAALVDLLEGEIEPLPIQSGTRLRVPFRPFQILTLRLTPER